MDKTASLLKTLGDTNRLRIINLLMVRPVCVCEMAHVLGIRQPSVSRHLKKLAVAGLVATSQDGFWTNYALRPAGKMASRVIACVRAWLETDPVGRRDRKILLRADRKRLCCR